MKKDRNRNMKLNLQVVNPMLHEQARKDFMEGDALGFVVNAGQGAALALVFDNMLALKLRGIYEEALLNAFVATRSNHSNWSVAVLKSMFKMADPEKLLAAGDPLPDGEKFVIFRGVAGVGRRRRIRTGYSWSLDKSRAWWFANRLGLPDPAVYKATVSRTEVLAYIDDRNEREVICRPKRISRLPLSKEEIAITADLVQNQNQQAQANWLAEIRTTANEI